jgi:hypothetical protein
MLPDPFQSPPPSARELCRLFYLRAVIYGALFYGLLFYGLLFQVAQHGMPLFILHFEVTFAPAGEGGDRLADIQAELEA